MSVAHGPYAQRLSPPQAQNCEPLAAFTLHLIQAMLRTGYYAADHPEAQKSLAGLYGQFRLVIGKQPTLTYSVEQVRQERAIRIDGYTSETLSLQKVMIKGMADLFTPKFLEFLDRWKLLSFSFRADCTAEEFDSFIALISQPPTAEQKTMEAAQRLTKAFVNQHILHISTVFDHDIVGRERRLPWRVKMALSRLRRDLRMLPLYERASAEQIRRLKLLLIDDVIRPMRTAALLKDFLVNCDLVAADIAELEETQVEREIIANLSTEMLVATAEEIVKDLEGDASGQLEPKDERSPEVARRSLVLRDIADRLCSTEGSLEQDFLESLLRQNALSLDDLPPPVRRELETRRLADAFLRREDDYLLCLAQLSPIDAAKKLIAVLQRIWPELLRRREYVVIADILQVIDEGRRVSQTAEAFAQLGDLLHEATTGADQVQALLEELRFCEHKDERERLVDILAFVGEPAAPPLMEMYADCDKPVRMSVFEVLDRMGTVVLQPFLIRLPSIEHEWAMVHHVLAAVADHGDSALAEAVARFLVHENQHVREAALSALFKLLGSAGERYYLQALKDRESSVRKVAVAFLGRIRSRDRLALDFYARALDASASNEYREEETVVIQVVETLGDFTDTSAEGVGDAERILLTALRSAPRKGILGRLKKGHRAHSERVLIAVCEALAVIGTSAALDPLSELAASNGQLVSEKAAAAADEIRKR